jgi:hypothetical protein
MSAVSFLDDLKRQAATLRTPVTIEPVDLERNSRLSNGACRITRDYWKELSDQLNVITPPSKARYLVDTRHPLEDLRCRNFRVLPVSRKDHAGEEHFESVMLVWQANGSGKRLRLEKTFPGEIERARAALRQAGIQFHEESIRQGDSGRTAGVALEFMPDVTASVRVLPLRESGRVKLIFTNVDQLERVEAEFPAVGMRLRQLDEIAKWIVGQPHRVLEYASDVKRFQS